MLRRNIYTRMDNQRKDCPDLRRPPPSKKETGPNNYKSITCLLLMWKIQKAQINQGDILLAVDCSPKMRKDVTREHEEQENTLIYTSSRRAKRDEKLWKTGEWNWQQEEKISWSKNPERYIPGRYAITITICNSDVATQLHT